MSIKGKPVTSAPPLLKNASAAPFVYFDNAPLYGIVGLGIEVELTAATIVPKADGTIAREAVCVSHLRCSPHAALALIDSLQKAIEMNKNQASSLAAQAAEVAKAAPADKAT
ncbi:hypothetical protein [Bradyrhizobium betae]|uniref:Uncharacterized protein n=1 Tax=Bradyrhizobium betae TaxID=244734 RepID=A0A5P6P161_9BRAD|nr:hypothetical protein [Bradyrhizobium betae]MCS3725499.1 hypothetical protein [Bradyrhizobium betae]QFI71213.1 hypothetical protein F8237_01785 [Bradyrhizobium betae]